MSVFEGKKAVVIGGSGGIGKAIARMLSQNGADVLIHGRTKVKVEKTVKELTDENSGKVSGIVFDFSFDSFKTLEDNELINKIDGADILCVCYGPFVQKPLDKMSGEDWQTVAMLDYGLPGFLVSRVLASMTKKSWGRILLFGGTGTNFRNEFITNAAYAGAKTGVGVIVQSVAASYACSGITCNGILPGFTETEYINEQQAEVLRNKMPLKKLISVDNIAEAAKMLLSSDNFNGILLRVDGGWSPIL